MQIAITTTAPDVEAAVDPRFGQAPYIVLVDTEAMEARAYTNPAPQMGGHGMIAARFCAMQGVDAIASDDYCPHSYAGLRSVGIAMYQADASQTAVQVVEQYLAGSLAPAPVPAPGQHGGHGGHGQHPTGPVPEQGAQAKQAIPLRTV
jgi:predicted Fe-Mo cluster-binding NifX family protein